MRLMLGDTGRIGRSETTAHVDPDARAEAKVTVRLSRAHATALADRARASDMAQGAYVAQLLEGCVPSALPADHRSSVEALTKSTDRLAAMSVDLNAFMRLLGHVPNTKLAHCPEGILSLSKDVREHVACASVLIAELQPGRRARS
jgi:hypothetical protein